MKALQLVIADGPQSASMADVDCPEPKSGEGRVRLAAAALNHRELWIASGTYPGIPRTCTLGCDGPGVMEWGGPGGAGAGAGRAVARLWGLWSCGHESIAR